MKFPSFLATSTLALSAASAQPNAGQRQIIGRGYGMFIHFGVNTFKVKPRSAR